MHAEVLPLCIHLHRTILEAPGANIWQFLERNDLMAWVQNEGGCMIRPIEDGQEWYAPSYCITERRKGS